MEKQLLAIGVFIETKTVNYRPCSLSLTVFETVLLNDLNY